MLGMMKRGIFFSFLVLSFLFSGGKYFSTGQLVCLISEKLTREETGKDEKVLHLVHMVMYLF